MSLNKRKNNEQSPSGKDYLMEKKQKNLNQKINSEKDLTRFVKWPKYIKIQRQRRIFCQKLKIPPAIFQFTRTLDKNMTNEIFKTLSAYKKKASQKNGSQFKKNLENESQKKKIWIEHGIDTVSKLIRKQKSLFVLIANDVNPIDCIVWMPTLCAKLGVPYCIVKNKAKLGSLVNRKTTSCIALTYSKTKDSEQFKNLIECFKKNFNGRYHEAIKRWSDGQK